MAVLVLVLLGGGGGAGGRGPGLVGGGDGARVDVATEDAVVAVLSLHQAELDLSAAAASHVPLLAAPGPLGRASAIEQARAQAQTVLADLRQQPVAPGTPGQTYLAHPDHDALLDLAGDVAAQARTMALLGEVHAALLDSSGTALPPDPVAQLEQVRVTAGTAPAAAEWAGTLLAVLQGDGDRAAAASARRAAVDGWASTARRIGPAGGEDLVAFLNGIDPDVIAHLAGHPLAGPALQTLREGSGGPADG